MTRDVYKASLFGVGMLALLLWCAGLPLWFAICIFVAFALDAWPGRSR